MREDLVVLVERARVMLVVCRFGVGERVIITRLGFEIVLRSAGHSRSPQNV